MTSVKQQKKPSSDEKDEYQDCPICCDTRRVKAWVQCPDCSFACCRGCTKRYLKESGSMTPNCMSHGCKKQWDFEFVAENTHQAFHNKEYRDHRAKLLMQREKSLLPATQPLAVEEIQRHKLGPEMDVLLAENYRHRLIIAENDKKVQALRRRQTTRSWLQGRKKEAKSDFRFIAHCPNEECNGYVNKNWKCDLCDQYACAACHQAKESRNDEDHVCDKDDVETAKLLAKDTKPCPGCQIPIHMISGCDQMYCQHEDTLIWLWSGEKKRAKEIVVGDVLIGDDGTPRRVESLTSGVANMFEIKQRFGEDYKVIGKHLLSLKEKGKTVDITVEDYLQLSERQRKRGYHRVVCEMIQWKHQSVPIDPYILGLWLGDGTTRGDGFASNDPELIQVWVNWGIQNGLEITHGRPYGYDIRTESQGKMVPVGYNSMKTCTGCSKKPSLCCASMEELELLQENEPTNELYKSLYMWRENLPEMSGKLVLGKNRIPNPFQEMLNKCGVLNNKHIPPEYLQNDEKTRLALLAGIIDTDGNKGRLAYRISQCIDREELCEGIIDLAHSLGFATTRKTHMPGQITFPHGKTYTGKKQISIRIMGNCSRIPVRLPHKKILDVSSYPVSTIKVKPVGSERYAGWSVSGGSSRYLLGDGTVTHNCTQCHTAFSWKTGKLETGVIHNPHYYQFQRQNNGGVAPRVQGDVRCGGVPDVWTIRHHFADNGLGAPDWLDEARRIIDHINHVELQRYPDDLDVGTHIDLRVMYLVKEISEKKWMSELKKREKRREKNRAIHMILRMFSDTLGAMFGNLTMQKNSNDIQKVMLEMYALRQYFNDNMEKVETRFKNKTPRVELNWKFKAVGGNTRRR